MSFGRVLCLLSSTRPGVSGYFQGAAGCGVRTAASPPCAQGPLLCATEPRRDRKPACSLQLSLPGLAASWGHRAVPAPYLGDFAQLCTLYLMGGQPALKAFSSPLFCAAPSHPLSGRAVGLSSEKWELLACLGQAPEEWWWVLLASSG